VVKKFNGGKLEQYEICMFVCVYIYILLKNVMKTIKIIFLDLNIEMIIYVIMSTCSYV